MPRSLSPSVESALAETVITLALFAKIAFADNTLYLFTGRGTITPAGPAYSATSTFPYGQTFSGLGWLCKVSTVTQTSKIQAQSVTLSLSGIPSSLLSEAIDQVRVTGTVTLWYGLFSDAALIADPVQILSGALDVPTLTDGGDACTLDITCENTLLDLNEAPDRRFDDPDQQQLYPGDLGFSFVQALQNMQLFWPNNAANASPYPLYMSISLSAPDVAVGATITATITIHYSDGSSYTQPGGSGSGRAFILQFASSNPRIATITYGSSLEITGVSPGACNLMVRVPGESTHGGYGDQIWRQIAQLFVSG